VRPGGLEVKNSPLFDGSTPKNRPGWTRSIEFIDIVSDTVEGSGEAVCLDPIHLIVEYRMKPEGVERAAEQ